MEQAFEKLLSRALRARVSDIHFVFEEEELTICMRSISGIIRLKSQPDDIRLFNYLMYRAHLDLTSPLPQSGCFSYYYRGSFYDFRMAVILDARNRDGVLRILNFHNGLKPEQLTCQPDILRRMDEMLRRRSGLVLFTGLTGSGKTTTMYSLLRSVKGRSIYSLEDPVEVHQKNIVQIEMNFNAGMNYESAIRQILRHNPDIIMIGEIRDENSARMAVRAALTGTLVLSSLHSRSAQSAIRRLTDLGVRADDLADILAGVFNQRLCRKADENGYIGIYEFISNSEVRQVLSGGILNDQLADNVAQAQVQGLISRQETLYG